MSTCTWNLWHYSRKYYACACSIKSIFVFTFMYDIYSKFM